MSNKICLAYISGSDKQDGTFEKNLKQIDFKMLTHISVAFSKIKETDGKWLPYISDEIKSGINKIKSEIISQNADTKLLLSVGGAMADGFCQASRTDDNRKNFTDRIIEIVNEFSLDGIDIDWEYPGESMLGITCCEHCKTDFILLLQELRNRLGEKLLTVAVGSNKYFGIDVKQLGRIVDYVLVMTYDLGIMHSNVCLSKTLYQGAKWCFDTEFDVEKKANWARQNCLGGVFCWEITGDDNNRILNAMNKGIFGE